MPYRRGKPTLETVEPPAAVTVTPNEKVEVPAGIVSAGPVDLRAVERAGGRATAGAAEGRACRHDVADVGRERGPGVADGQACRSACRRVPASVADTDLTIVGFTSSWFVTVLLFDGVGVSVDVALAVFEIV